MSFESPPFRWSTETRAIVRAMASEICMEFDLRCLPVAVKENTGFSVLLSSFYLHVQVSLLDRCFYLFLLELKVRHLVVRL